MGFNYVASCFGTYGSSERCFEVNSFEIVGYGDLYDTRLLCPGISPASARVTPSEVGFSVALVSSDSGVWYA